MYKCHIHDQAGTGTEIEVTPEMEEAGFQVLCDSGITDCPQGADRVLVVEIYRAMFGVRNRGSLPSKNKKTGQAYVRCSGTLRQNP